MASEMEARARAAIVDALPGAIADSNIARDAIAKAGAVFAREEVARALEEAADAMAEAVAAPLPKGLTSEVTDSAFAACEHHCRARAAAIRGAG
jgi:hypothetical protein